MNNLVMDAIADVFAEVERRMAPAIVKEPCPWCGGSGRHSRRVGYLLAIEKCRACNGHGRISVETVEATP